MNLNTISFALVGKANKYKTQLLINYCQTFEVFIYGAIKPFFFSKINYFNNHLSIINYGYDIEKLHWKKNAEK
jgi:hypothetical protein